MYEYLDDPDEVWAIRAAAAVEAWGPLQSREIVNRHPSGLTLEEMKKIGFPRTVYRKGGLPGTKYAHVEDIPSDGYLEFLFCEIRNVLNGSSQTECAAELLPTACPDPAKEITDLLGNGKRMEAVNARLSHQKEAGKPFTKASLYRNARQHKTEYHKWLSGKHSSDSAAGRAIERMLTTGWDQKEPIGWVKKVPKS